MNTNRISTSASPKPALMSEGASLGPERQGSSVSKASALKQRAEVALVWAVILGPLVVTTVRQEWRIEFLAFLALTAAVLALRHLRQLWQLMRSTWLVWCGIGGLTLWIVLETQFTPSGPSILYEGKAAVALVVTLVAFALIPLVNRNGDRDRLIEGAITAAEFFIIGQLFLSFFLGIGEHHDYRSGVVRAFGFLGDSMSPILGFFVLKHALDRRPVRCLLSAFALAITGGKMALAIIFVGLIGLLLLRRDFWRPMRNGFVAILLAQLALQLSFALELPPNKFVDLYAEDPLLAEEQSLGKRIEWLVKDIAASGSRRVLSLVAGIDIAYRHPLVGVGYLQTAKQIPVVATRDPFGVDKFLEAPKVSWSKVKAVDNASLRMAAELGIVGLVLFWTVCVGMILIFLKPIADLRRSGPEMRNMLETAAAVWGISFILVNQTAAWMTPGHLQLTWLALCLGITAAKVLHKASAVSSEDSGAAYRRTDF